ncbi:signal peptidase I [Agromyces bauzanensis]
MRQESTGASRWVSGRRTGLPVWAHLLIALLVVALVQALVVKIYSVPSGSMEQTLSVGARVLADRIAYNVGDPERGDVVVFRARESWAAGAPTRTWFEGALVWLAGMVGIGPGDYTLVKRVIGVPGDSVACCDASGRVTVNGNPIDEPYVFEDHEFEAGTLDCETTVRSSRCFQSIVVPDSEYLVLGDHRSDSADSVIGCRGAPDGTECARFVDRDDVAGRVFQVVYPFGRWGAV